MSRYYMDPVVELRKTAIRTPTREIVFEAARPLGLRNDVLTRLANGLEQATTVGQAATAIRLALQYQVERNPAWLSRLQSTDSEWDGHGDNGDLYVFIMKIIKPNSIDPETAHPALLEHLRDRVMPAFPAVVDALRVKVMGLPIKPLKPERVRTEATPLKLSGQELDDLLAKLESVTTYGEAITALGSAIADLDPTRRNDIRDNDILESFLDRVVEVDTERLPQFAELQDVFFNRSYVTSAALQVAAETAWAIGEQGLTTSA